MICSYKRKNSANLKSRQNYFFSDLLKADSILFRFTAINLNSKKTFLPKFSQIEKFHSLLSSAPGWGGKKIVYEQIGYRGKVATTMELSAQSPFSQPKGHLGKSPSSYCSHSLNCHLSAFPELSLVYYTFPSLKKKIHVLQYAINSWIFLTLWNKVIKLLVYCCSEHFLLKTIPTQWMTKRSRL